MHRAASVDVRCPRALEHGHVACVGPAYATRINHNLRVRVGRPRGRSCKRDAVDKVLGEPLGSRTDIRRDHPHGDGVDVELPALVIRNHAEEQPAGPRARGGGQVAKQPPNVGHQRLAKRHGSSREATQGAAPTASATDSGSLGTSRWTGGSIVEAAQASSAERTASADCVPRRPHRRRTGAIRPAPPDPLRHTSGRPHRVARAEAGSHHAQRTGRHGAAARQAGNRSSASTVSPRQTQACTRSRRVCPDHPPSAARSARRGPSGVARLRVPPKPIRIRPLSDVTHMMPSGRVATEKRPRDHRQDLASSRSRSWNARG